MELQKKINNSKNHVKAYLFKNRSIIFIILLVLLIFFLIFNLFKISSKYKKSLENNYDMAFYQLNDYMRNLEIYLAKSMIVNSPESGAENLTYIWKEANLAQIYLGMLPIQSSEIENVERFLNQVSDYSFSLSRKTINNESLTNEDLNNLNKMHDYSLEMEKTLNQLSTDLDNNKIFWNDLTQELQNDNVKQASNLTKDSFSMIQENFHEYAGLIYDGAFSDHITNIEKVGLTGDNIKEPQAKAVVENIFKNNVIDIKLNSVEDNANIPCFEYSVTLNNNENVIISISKKGGHIVFFNCNRPVNNENLDVEDADKIALEFFNNNNFPNMVKTYYVKNSGIMTINYAYEQDNVIVYPDLIKIKIALDNGEILGLETTGYLNCHKNRAIPDVKISSEEALSKINKNLVIESQRLAIIPTEFQTELFCWEFKGKMNEREFLVYINAENGKEEDILIILNTENGILTM